MCRIALVCLAFACACGPRTEQPEKTSRPDVILVVIDTWRWDALGANGVNKRDVTPNLDRLAQRGVLFKRAFTQSPWTLPSVATLLTGRHPTVHGAFGRLADVSPIHPSVTTLPELFQKGGYKTVALVNAPFLQAKFGFDRGFDTYDFHRSTNHQVRRADVTVDRAVEYLRQMADRPLFLLVHLFDLHLDYDPPEATRGQWTKGYEGRLKSPFNNLGRLRAGPRFDPPPADRRFLRGLYEEEVSAVDLALGRLFEELETRGPEHEYIVVVTADHGEEFGDHDGWEHGHTMYWEQVQVPLIVVPPRSVSAARSVVDAQVRTLDVVPTLLDAVDLEVPRGLPGRSLWPWVRGDGEPAHRIAYAEREHLGRPAAALRDGAFTLVHYLKEGHSELFDAVHDPFETTNVAASEPEVVERLEERLQGVRRALERQALALEESPRVVDLDSELLEQLRSLGYL